MGQALRKPKQHKAKAAKTRPVSVARAKFYVPSTLRRCYARIIDSSILALPMMVFGYYAIRSGMATFGPTGLSLGWGLIALCTITWFSYQLLFLKFKARTPGKMLMGLYVTNLDTHLARLTWTQALIRTASELLSIFLSLIPQAVALFREDRRHVYDLLARTQVMQDRPRKTEAEPRLFVGTLILVYLTLNAFYKYHRMSESMQVDSKGIKFQIDPSSMSERV